MALTIKIQKIVTVLLLLAAVPLNAQVLWTDNVDGYNTGAFTTGQGGWQTFVYGSEIRIISEPGKGNVLAWGWNYLTPGNGSSAYGVKDGLIALWNSRSAGNNVLKFEFDFLGKDFTNSPGQRFSTGITFDSNPSFFRCAVNLNEKYIDATSTYPTLNHRTPYNNTWIKTEVYIEYNANTNTSYHIYTTFKLFGSIRAERN